MNVSASVRMKRPTGGEPRCRIVSGDRVGRSHAACAILLGHVSPTSCSRPPMTAIDPAVEPKPSVTASPVRRSLPGHLTSGDVARATVVASACLVVIVLLWVAREILLTAFIGVLFGLAVGVGAGWLTRFRIPRGIGAALVTFG